MGRNTMERKRRYTLEEKQEEGRDQETKDKDVKFAFWWDCSEVEGGLTNYVWSMSVPNLTNFL